MKMRTLFAANAVVEVLFGVGFLALPTLVLSIFGAQTDPTGTMLTRVAGGVIVSLAIISWFGKDAAGSAQNAMVWGFIFAHLQAGFFTVLSILGGSFNALAWSAVVMDAVFVGLFLWVRGRK